MARKSDVIRGFLVTRNKGKVGEARHSSRVSFPYEPTCPFIAAILVYH